MLELEFSMGGAYLQIHWQRDPPILELGRGRTSDPARAACLGLEVVKLSFVWAIDDIDVDGIGFRVGSTGILRGHWSNGGDFLGSCRPCGCRCDRYCLGFGIWFFDGLLLTVHLRLYILVDKIFGILNDFRDLIVGFPNGLFALLELLPQGFYDGIVFRITLRVCP